MDKIRIPYRFIKEIVDYFEHAAKTDFSNDEWTFETEGGNVLVAKSIKIDEKRYSIDFEWNPGGD